MITYEAGVHPTDPYTTCKNDIYSTHDKYALIANGHKTEPEGVLATFSCYEIPAVHESSTLLCTCSVEVAFGCALLQIFFVEFLLFTRHKSCI